MFAECCYLCVRHTPRYSIRSSPTRPNFQMTTFKAKNVFLVLGMGHNMNKLTYEYKKNQFYNNLVDLQCKCMRLDTPRIGQIWGFSAVTESKVFLKFSNLKKKHVVGFWKFQNLKNTFGSVTAAYFCRQNLIFIFRPKFPIH